MKCPMCGSDAVGVVFTRRFEYDPQWEWWAPLEEMRVKPSSPAECECGWVGKVSELEKLKT